MPWSRRTPDQNESQPLPPKLRTLRANYRVALSDGREHHFAVSADLRADSVEMTVELPRRYEDDPMAVPSELLDHVGRAMLQMRKELARAEGGLP